MSQPCLDLLPPHLNYVFLLQLFPAPACTPSTMLALAAAAFTMGTLACCQCFLHLYHSHSDQYIYQQNLNVGCQMEKEHVFSWRCLHLHSVEGVYLVGVGSSISPPAQAHEICLRPDSAEQMIEMFPAGHFCILLLLTCCGYPGCAFFRAFHTTCCAWNCKPPVF